MANRLTYLSLCFVLEHLDANKRFHIVSRSPKLQQFEKSIPLFLEYLSIEEDSIGINDVLYSIRKNDDVDDDQSNNLVRDEELEPGDLSTGNDDMYFLEFGVSTFGTPQMTTPIQQKLKYREAIKRLNCYWLGGRREIRVDRLRFNTDFKGVLRLPVNLQLKIKKLNSHINDFRRFLPIISPASFPLKKLRTEIRTQDIFKDITLKSAERLVFYMYMLDERVNSWFLNNYRDELVNKDVTIYNGRFEKGEAIRIVQRIIEYRRKVGRCFQMKRITMDRRHNFARAVESAFDVHRSDDHSYIRINDSLRLVYYYYKRENVDSVNMVFQMEFVDQGQLLDDTPTVSDPPEPMLLPIRENQQRWKMILIICISVLIFSLVEFFGS